MSQHDYDIANASGATVRADINSVLDAIASSNGGASAPSTTFANMWWFDENNDIMKQRNKANSAWILVAQKDGSGWRPYWDGSQLDSVFAKLAAPAFTGTVTMAGKLETNGELQMDGVVQTPAAVISSGASISLLMTGFNKKTIALATNTTITVSAEVADQVVEVWITQTAGGGTAAWSGVNDWIGGSAPTLSTTTGDIDIITLSSASDGSSIVAQHIGVAS